MARSNRVAESALVGDDRDAAYGHDLVGCPFAGQHAVEDLSRELVVDRAVVDEAWIARTSAGRDRQGRELDALFVGAAGQLGEPPLRAACGEARQRWSARPGAALPRLRCRASRARRSPSRPAVGPGVPAGGSGSDPSSSSTHSRDGATGTRSPRGSSVVLRVGLLATRRGHAGVLVPMPRLLPDRLPPGQDRRLAGDLVASCALDRAQRVTFLVSVRVPSPPAPAGARDRFTSQRKEPCSMRTSETPRPSSSSRRCPRTPEPLPAPSRGHR